MAISKKDENRFFTLLNEVKEKAKLPESYREFFVDGKFIAPTSRIKRTEYIEFYYSISKHCFVPHAYYGDTFFICRIKWSDIQKKGLTEIGLVNSVGTTIFKGIKKIYLTNTKNFEYVPSRTFEIIDYSHSDMYWDTYLGSYLPENLTDDEFVKIVFMCTRQQTRFLKNPYMVERFTKATHVVQDYIVRHIVNHNVHVLIMMLESIIHNCKHYVLIDDFLDYICDKFQEGVFEGNSDNIVFFFNKLLEECDISIPKKLTTYLEGALLKSASQNSSVFQDLDGDNYYGCNLLREYVLLFNKVFKCKPILNVNFMYFEFRTIGSDKLANLPVEFHYNPIQITPFDVLTDTQEIYNSIEIFGIQTHLDVLEELQEMSQINPSITISVDPSIKIYLPVLNRAIEQNYPNSNYFKSVLNLIESFETKVVEPNWRSENTTLHNLIYNFPTND